MKFQKGQPRPAGAGRKKGSKNKHRPIAELADAMGINPTEILLLFAAGDAKALGMRSVSPSLRLRAAGEAVKYLHAQPRELELKVKEPVKVVIEDYTAK